MKVAIEGKELVIRIEMEETPSTDASGKTLVVASSREQLSEQRHDPRQANHHRPERLHQAVAERARRLAQSRSKHGG